MRYNMRAALESQRACGFMFSLCGSVACSFARTHANTRQQLIERKTERMHGAPTWWLERVPTEKSVQTIW